MIQQKCAYISSLTMGLGGSALGGISTSEVYGVATFYNQFRYHPPGKHRINLPAMEIDILLILLRELACELYAGYKNLR